MDYRYHLAFTYHPYLRTTYFYNLFTKKNAAPTPRGTATFTQVWLDPATGMDVPTPHAEPRCILVVDFPLLLDFGRFPPSFASATAAHRGEYPVGPTTPTRVDHRDAPHIHILFTGQVRHYRSADLGRLPVYYVTCVGL